MNQYGLYFDNCIKLGDIIWFSAANYNGLYRYNLKNKSTERVTIFPNEEMWQMALYHSMCLYHDSLVFIPHWAKRISIYNTKTEMISQIEMPDFVVQLCDEPNFLCGVVYRDMLYMIGYKYSGIIKVDLKTKECKIIYEADEWVNVSMEPYFGEVAVEDNYIYIPCQFQNSVLILDMNYDKAEKKRVGKDSNRYCRIVKDGQNFYLIDKNTNNFVSWNVENDIWYETEVCFKEPYFDALIVYSKKYIWVISVLSGEICIVEKDTGKSQNAYLRNKPVVEYAVTCNDGVYFVDGCTGNWYFVDIQGTITNLHIKIEEPENIGMEEIWKGFSPARFGGIVGERPPYTLPYLIFHTQESKAAIGINTANVGNIIWDFINDLP